MERGLGPFQYFFLINNLYILFIFIFHFYKNRHWFLRTYIIGKSLQLLGILAIEFGKNNSLSNTMGIADLFFIVGFPFEIFGLISYNGHFNKKIFNIFLYTTILICLADVVMMLKQSKIGIISFSSIFFYIYAGIVLLIKKDRSRFRYLIGVTFIAYSIFSGIMALIPNPDMPPIPTPSSIKNMMPPIKNNIRESYESFMYFVMLVSSIGYLVILKEQDEFALDKAKEQINKENLTLKKIDGEKTKFFSIIAHDLRGPIGTLAKLTEILVESKSKFKEADFDKWLSMINQTATRTYTLLNNLLQWARSESGALMPHPEIIILKELSDEVIHLMQAFAHGKNIQLESNCPDNIQIFVDREMTRTVIRNLISNAIKFTKENGTIQVNAKQGEEIIYSVSDSGIGMSKEVINKLFALDSNYSTPGTNKEEGSGLGIKLTNEFVSKNNGRIWVESTLGVGSTFYVSFPRPRID
jgi:two-component system, sensor histidine kinase and response regulator